MNRTDASDFRLRPGRIRDRGRLAARRSLSFVNEVMKAAAKANGGPLPPSRLVGDRRRGGAPRKGRCSRIGRGQAAADRLKREAREQGAGRRHRRVIVKAQDRVLDLRPKAGQVSADFDRTLRLGRLQTLKRYGLAREVEPGVWTISEKLEPTLRELGERGDIIKTMHRAVTERGVERSTADYAIHRHRVEHGPVIGRVIEKGLAGDQLGDRMHLVIDGIDGRVHYVEIADAAQAEDARIGSIVEIGRAPPRSRPSDRNIAALAAETGIYRPSEHRAIAEAGNIRVPGDDYDGYIESHVRRLEALRRAGIVERINADRWSRDWLSRLERQEIARVGPEIARARGLTFRPAEAGNYVSGRLVGSVNLASGKFAMIEDGLGFSLVPWHPVLEKRLERHVSGIAMPDGEIDWTFGRSRGLGL